MENSYRELNVAVDGHVAVLTMDSPPVNALTRVLNGYGGDNNLLKELKAPLSGEDARERLVAFARTLVQKPQPTGDSPGEVKGIPREDGVAVRQVVAPAGDVHVTPVLLQGRRRESHRHYQNNPGSNRRESHDSPPLLRRHDGTGMDASAQAPPRRRPGSANASRDAPAPARRRDRPPGG